MVYHCTGCNDYGEVGEAVYGLRVIHRHKLVFPPLTPSLGSEKKQRADTAVAAVSAVAFLCIDICKKQSGSFKLIPLSEAFGLARRSGKSNEDSTPICRYPHSFQ